MERDRLRLTVALAASVFGLIALGGGGWAYLAQQRASRRAATERVVIAALDEATLLRGQAKAAPVGDLSKWAMAKTAADRARSALDAGESSAALRFRVDRVLTDIYREQSDAKIRLAEVEKDRKLLDRLNEIRLDPIRRTSDRGRSIPTMRRRSGSSASTLTVSTPMMPDDHWRSGPTRRRSPCFSTTGHSFDEKWSAPLVLRKTLGVAWSRWRERSTPIRGVMRCGGTLTVEMTGPFAVWRRTDEHWHPSQRGSLYLLARALELCEKEKPGQSSKEPIEILELAWRISPGDYQICSELGRICESKADRIRFRTAAVTAKPGDAWAHSFLARAYVDCSYNGLSYNWISPGWGGSNGSESARLAVSGTDSNAPRDGPRVLADVDLRKRFPSSDQEWSRYYEYCALFLVAKDGSVTGFGPVTNFSLSPFSAEDLNHALAEYKEAVRLKPSDPSYRVECGDAMVLHGDIRRHSPSTARQTGLSRGHTHLHEHIAHTFFIKGEFDLAIAEIQEQIRRYPVRGKATDRRLFLGTIYHKQGKNRLAFAAYRDELLQGGGRQQGFLRLALETTGTPEDVFKAYWDAVRSHPGDWHLQRTFLRDCLKLGMTSEVQAALDADIALLREKMRAMPKEIDLRLCLALALLARGDRNEAAVEFRKALELTQKDPAKCNDVAWTLATSSQANQRDGSIAVEFATRACELTGWKDANYLDTLAAAHAEAGDFDSAVRRQTEAISLVSDAKQKEDFGKRLKLYKDRKPFRDPAQ